MVISRGYNMINFDMKTLGGVKGLFVYNASFKTFVANGQPFHFGAHFHLIG